MTVVFFGTPEFALPSLEVLHSSRHRLVGVTSAPPKPQGRGRTVGQPPVARTAMKLGLPVLQPENLRNPGFLTALRDWKADVFAVIAFRILPEEVYNLPRFGAVNLHGSLLPAYRGAAPIQWALWNGERETGLTTFRIERQVDTGNILKQCRVEIADSDDAGSLSEKMAKAGASLLLETLDELEAGRLTTTPQDGSKATPAPKITKEHCRIDWQHSAASIRNQVRALSPEPGASFVLNDQTIKIYRCEVSEAQSELQPGEVLIGEQTLTIGSGRGASPLRDLAPAATGLPLASLAPI